MAFDSPGDAAKRSATESTRSATESGGDRPADVDERGPWLGSSSIILRARAAASRAIDKLSTSDDAVLEAEPVSPHQVELAPASSRQASDKKTFILLAAAITLGLVGAVILSATAPVYLFAATGRFRFSFPGLRTGESGGSTLYFGVLFLGGVLALTLGWLALVGRTLGSATSERSRSKWVLIALAIWAVPFVLGPIQLSSDAYSYEAQGYMRVWGLDPSAVGPNALPKPFCTPAESGANCFWRAADPIWRNSPAPYGPVSVATAVAAVTVSGLDTYWASYAFRALAVAGVAMAGFGLYSIARSRRVSPSVALAIGIANPVVLLHLVGGAHNDALMMGLLVLGLAAWEKSRRWLAVVLVTLAVCVKLPAVIALAFIAFCWKGRDADWKQRMVDFPIVGAAVAGIVGVLCLIVGIGFGWVTALSSTGSVFSTFSPSTKLGFIVSDLLNAVGLNINPLSVVAATRGLGLLATGAIVTVLLLRSPKVGVTKSVGMALLVLMLGSPVIWPWYLPVAFAVLAASGVRKYWPSLIVLIVATGLIVWPTSVDAVVPLSRYQHWLGLLVVVFVAVCCVAVQYMARNAERRRARGEHVSAFGSMLIGSVSTVGAVGLTDSTPTVAPTADLAVEPVS